MFLRWAPEFLRWAPEAPCFARRLRRSDLNEVMQIPGREEGRLARRAIWDRDLPGWILRPGPILTRGLS
eukprot:201645-Alexandrium_andersonii.AAC.1